MTKTSNEVCQEALEILEVVAEGETMSADDQARAYRHLVSRFDRFGREGLVFTWTIETVPEWAFLPLSRLLAASLAMSYGRSIEFNERAELHNLRLVSQQDDRVDPRDLDEDDTVSEAEADAFARSLFF